MSQSFSALIKQAQAGRPDIPDSWKQGRTAYGGLSAALLLAYSKSQHEALPPLRSALINFTGPVTGAPNLSAELLRRGRNVTTIQARADIDGNAVCTGTFAFGAPRESHLQIDHPAPDAEPPEETEPYIDQVSPFVPAFLNNFETRLIEGTRPMRGGTRGYLRLWARHAEPAARDGETALLCLGDILPPSTLPIAKKLGPVSSMTWICNILRSPETEDGWYQVECDLTAVQDGYCSQVMRIWNSQGQLVIEGMQSIAVFV